jgi:hypothetical protein
MKTILERHYALVVTASIKITPAGFGDGLYGRISFWHAH